MKKEWMALVLIIVLIGIVFIINQSESGSKINDTRPEVGFLAPDFKLWNDIDQNYFKLSDFKGKPVFINFWASWCPPCQEEMPYIQQGYEQYKDMVVFIGINATYSDSEKDARAFMQANHYEMPYVLDKDGVASQAYRALSLPTSFFIDKDGIIRAIKRGPMSFNQLESYLKLILEDK